MRKEATHLGYREEMAFIKPPDCHAIYLIAQHLQKMTQC